MATLAGRALMSSPSRRRPRSTRSACNAVSSMTRTIASAISSGPARRGRSKPASPTVSGIAPHAACDHRDVERHRLEQRDAEPLVLAHGDERRSRAGNIAARSVGRPDPTRWTCGRLSSRSCALIASAYRANRFCPTSRRYGSQSEIGRGHVHRFHQEVGTLVRQELPDEQQERIAERLVEVIRRRWHLVDIRGRPRGIDDRRDDHPHVLVSDGFELARVEVRVGDRRCDTRGRSRTSSLASEHEQLGERLVESLEVLRRRDVVVHEHDRLVPARQERMQLRLADRRVVHEHVTEVLRGVVIESLHLAGQLGRKMPGEDLRRPDPAQHVAQFERGVGDRVAGRGCSDDLMNAYHAGIIGPRSARSPAARTGVD